MHIDEIDYTVLDVETTGLYPYAGDRICEVGAIRVDASGKVSTFQELIDPERDISPGAFAVNRITSEMLAGKPTVDKVMPRFFDFLKGSVLVAYNAGFDLGFLECALGSKRGALEDFKTIDVLKLARKLFPEIGKYRLSHVAMTLGINTEGEHRALADAIMTQKLFEKEKEILKAKNIFSLEEISEPTKCRYDYREEGYGELIDIFQDAIVKNETLNIVYKSTWDNSVTSRNITPIEIKHGYDKTYLTAYCHLRKGERNFRLDCIIDAKQGKRD